MLPSSTSQSNPDTNNGLSPRPIYTQPEIDPGFEELQTRELDSDGVGETWLRGGFRRQWQKLSLKTKATAMALAIGTIPVLGVGLAADYFATKSITQQILNVKASRALGLADKTNRFVFERYADLQTLANVPIFTNAKLWAITTRQEKDAFLNLHVETHNSYDSIALVDLKGNVIAQSQGEYLPNLSDRDYFQAVIKTNSPFIGEPQISQVLGTYTIFMAAPVRDTATNRTVAVLRTSIPLDSLKGTLANFKTSGDQYHLLDGSGKLILDSNDVYLHKDARAEFSVLPQLQAAQRAGAAVGFDRELNTKVVTAYAPFQRLEGFPELEWEAVVTTDPAYTFAPQKQLLQVLIIGTVLTVLLVGAIAAYLANRGTRRIVAATSAVEKLGRGELNTFVPVEGKDELAMLAFNINRMSSQIRSLLHQQEGETERARFFINLASSGARNQDLEVFFNKALTKAREILNAERVVIYRFYSDWSGYIATESVAPGWPVALADQIEDPCIKPGLIEAYKKGRVVSTNNVFKAGFHPEHLKLLSRLEVKSNLVTPILKNDQLFGLLIAHHCSEIHVWHHWEINFLTQLAAQLGLVLERMTLLEQVRTAKEEL